jgi:hypothetical protein
VHKFGWFPDGVHDEPYEYSNIWTREKTSGPNRLAIAPRANHVGLIQKLAEQMSGPFLLLYVLVVPRTESEPGRYQSEPIDEEELNRFLCRYKNFLENDARHNLWIRSSDDSMLVFDRHNIIYAYGPLEMFTSTLTSSGLNESADIKFPDPHSHHYQSEFDDSERKILQEQSWVRSPLRKGDENPE